MTATNVHLFDFNGNQIAYRKFGYGPATLLAFHGFGQSSQIYWSIERRLGRQFTIFALDLFFHGSSRYTGSQLLTKTDWSELLTAFLNEQRIARFSVMGFSLGGRFALVTAENFASRLDQLILIAPDGITYNFWYSLATGSSPGRRFFRYMLEHLFVLNRLGYILIRFGLLDQSIIRFVDARLNSPHHREQIYQTWTHFRHIRPDLACISKDLNTYPIRTHFFTGAFDQLVPGTYILPLAKRLRHYTLTVLKTGHNRLIELAVDALSDT